MSEHALPPIVVVAGPSASGKSALALALAEAFDGTVINADSMQVYRDLRVLTARPTPAEEARAPHRLYGVIDAAEACSAGRWRAMALAETAAAQKAGRLAILAGGTGLYLRALLEGLAPIPPVMESVRQEARALHARLGGAAFKDALAALDAETAAALAPGDSQRLIRAYEVARATGRGLVDWRRAPTPPSAFRTAAVVLLPPRPALYTRCDARFLRMVEEGAEAEAAALLARELDPRLPAMKAVGLAELAAFVAGRCSLPEAIAAAQQATRRYVKRQCTWFRHQLPESEHLQKMVVGEQFSESLQGQIFPFIRQFLLTVKS
ncbi:MAG TPA: tRNA (adenosine(37)-N6)-dimethylallyltransferase MiaA [Stellaceae bacterium]|nr:tRNA (adenosine(37)-N6)-dimethylallyltransferase MiaA [Stellaceae bacterium]